MPPCYKHVMQSVSQVTGSFFSSCISQFQTVFPYAGLLVCETVRLLLSHARQPYKVEHLLGPSGKLGFGFRSKYFDGQASGFGRYYFDPLLPMPKAYAQYKDVTPIDYAWVSGANVKVEWKTSHHFSLSSNVSSVYGEYELEDGSSIPWEAATTRARIP